MAAEKDSLIILQPAGAPVPAGFSAISSMISLASLPEKLHEQVLRAMWPGEEPVLVARPVPTIVNRVSKPYIFFLVFAIFFVSLFVFCSGFAALPFLALFIALPVGGIWRTYWQMQRTVYIITERRALVVRAAGRKAWQTLSWPLTAGLVKERVLRADGSGDLILGYESSRDAEGGTTSVPQGFFNLPELRRVEQILMDIAPVPRG